MSYDLHFVPKTADQSWEDALSGEFPDTPPDAAAWAAITDAARRILGEVEVESGRSSFELEHEPTGIELAVYGGYASLTVPFWYKGEDAVQVVRALYALALVVERHTGLIGYDPQVEAPVAEAGPERAVAVFDDVAADFARRGIRSPSNDL
ncbi:hypothetical protein ACQP00_15215 [Dactylosporangium sp. CS-047395]|uniref:hypothetical protein n=1 Tax=Dactylosporangium sp. CS-047395 TaxID=3239936 RepID=UPI003D9023F0